VRPPFALRDVGLVARYELAEAMRSRLLVVMVLLFVGAGALGAWGFTEILERVEQNAAKITGAPAPKRPGKVARRLREAGSYREMVKVFVGDDAKADYFSSIPPIVLFFAWVSLNFTPWLVFFTSSETIATEVGNRGIRYTVLRTSRLQYAAGKFVGQTAIVVGVTALSALTFYLVAALALDGFEAGATARGLVTHWPRVVLYLMPMLAWSLLASMVTSSANLARILALGGGVVLSIFWGLAAHPPPWLRTGAVADAVRDLLPYLTPFGHYDGLLYPPGGALASDVAVCLALTVVYFAIGFAVLRRRDL
jgi:ABC-type transport system involved in multi-copper enzyme maturation permease subunit